jgi:diguanylate cyclase (GGDEF)-like protein
MERTEKKRILIVEADRDVVAQVQNDLDEGGYRTYSASEGLEAIDLIYSEPPDLILVARELPSEGGILVCQELKKEHIFGHLPILLIVNGKDRHDEIRWDEFPVDDYLVKPVARDELLQRVSLAFSRISRTLDANPLTRLPGNNSIIQEIEGHLKSGGVFVLAYADLDHFKAFNDKYGFGRGDEVLRMTARIITNVVRQFGSEHAFVGHIGGDDFVFLVSPDRIDQVCAEMIRHFDLIVSTFYDEEDRMARRIETMDRQGKATSFPLMSLSIAVVSNEKRQFSHFGEISAIAAELKKYVKQFKGSNYFKDRRAL